MNQYLSIKPQNDQLSRNIDQYPELKLQQLPLKMSIPTNETQATAILTAMDYYIDELQCNLQAKRPNSQKMLMQLSIDVLLRLNFELDKKITENAFKKKFLFRMLSTDAELLFYCYRSLGYSVPLHVAEMLNRDKISVFMAAIEKQIHHRSTFSEIYNR